MACKFAYSGRSSTKTLLVASNLVLVTISLFIGSAQSVISLETVPADFEDALLVGGIAAPIDMAWTPDGRMLITMKAGQLRVYVSGTLLSGSALDLSGVLCTENERGLGGVAVHPRFGLNHYIYLYYTFSKFGTCVDSEVSGPVNRLSRFVLNSNNMVDLASEVVLLDTPPLPTNMHNGGDMSFGKDGYLYVTVGDGGSAYGSNPDTPSDPGVLFGKILRITDSGGIPSSNPFTGVGTARCNVNGVPPEGSAAGTKCQEVFATGLRNPFRFAFDPNAQGARFYINDVGENLWEEIDLGQASADYGWSDREGPCATGSTTDCIPSPGVTDPIHWYGHNVTVGGNGCDVITGGAFVPTGTWPTFFDGSYLFADFLCGQIWTLKADGSGGYSESAFATVAPAGLVSMSFGPFGLTQELYYLTHALGGQLRIIRYTGPPTPTTLATNFRVDWSDYDNDGRVTILDVAQAAVVYDGANSYWDYDLNGRVDIVELATIASYYNLSFNTSPYPGEGSPPGTMDPSWNSQCGQLPPPDQNYCNNLP